jgi:hypothetical protein
MMLRQFRMNIMEFIKITPETLPAEFAPVLITDGEEVTAAMRVNTTGEDWFWGLPGWSCNDLELDFQPTHYAIINLNEFSIK